MSREQGLWQQAATPTTVCTECHALLAQNDEWRHRDWHTRMDERLAGLEEWA